MQQLVCFLQFSDERVSYHLFVDSLKPIELLICFSALVRWGESGGKRAWENYSLKAQLTFHSGKMYTTHFRHRMKELIPSPDLLRSSCSSDIKKYAHSCYPSLSLFWSYGYLFSTPSLSVSLSPYTCHHCWFFKNLTSSFFFDLTLPKAFISILPPRPLLSWFYLDFIVPITVLSQSILSSLTSTPEVPVLEFPPLQFLDLVGTTIHKPYNFFCVHPHQILISLIPNTVSMAHHCIHWRFFTCALNTSAFLPSQVMFLTKP